MLKMPHAIAALAALALLATASPCAVAGPPGHAKHGKKAGKAHKKHYKAKGWGGPPPWAPAHGYRRKYVTYRTHDHREVRIEESRLVALPDVGLARCNRDLVGAIFGGAAGAAIGSRLGKGDGRTAATIGGAILGALIGGNIGRAMDQVDQSCIGQALERAESGRPVAWRNPDNGRTYEVTPSRTYRSAGGMYCREYTTKVIIDGREQSAHGRACRQPDGSWKREG